ncbi:MAG: AbrB/MazE/SpoVT family DNA-binding domain-containing protein [Blastocatellia bacterium]
MVAKIQKWGNSQGLRLAKHVLESAGIEVGDDVEIIVGEKEIHLRKKARPKFILAEMVARMPKNYRAKEESFGKPVGKEEW